ncbi:MAG TPA: LysM peptidoglycan-binding domain-containing protein [Chloroflexia bacterium]|jgi:nucleoid-associated protein YgaU|nr:LysM peptidoglycan-binding domain-containing protein [Chloroflexia bacterium]
MLRFKTFLLVGLLALAASVAGGSGAAAQGLSSTAAAGPAPGTTYTVQRGDTLSNIAARAYGNAGAWSCILNANRWISNAQYVQAGWKLVLPAANACAGLPAGGTAGTSYTVQRGDSLSSIAFRVYGNAGAWSCIWAANKWIANPSYLQAGWKIALPASGSCGGGGTPPPAVRYHTVTHTETLSGIACLYYADCNYWRIYNANRDKIWNVNYILPGTVLRIP